MAVIKPWLGARYKYGGSSKSGTDCSGYVMQIYKEKTGKVFLTAPELCSKWEKKLIWRIYKPEIWFSLVIYGVSIT
jgi:hypothetical protein